VKLLVAGVTGQLGTALTEALTEAPWGDVTLVPVLRERSASRRLVDPALLGGHLTGDVRAHHWGLADAELDRLAGQIDAVVNLAGQTNWVGRSADLHATNVRGAEFGYELARQLQARAGRPVPYVYASSIFVAGGMIGTIPEAPLPGGPDRTAYEQSKWLAEQRLTSACRTSADPPLLISRVCALVGDSRTGRTLKRNSLYLLGDRWDTLPGGVLPAMRGARIDALPRDVAAATLLRAITAMVGRSPGRAVICHLGTGETAPSLRSLLEAAQTGHPLRFRHEPRILRVGARPLVWATANAERFAALPPDRQGSLIGLRYVALDRIFPRAVLASLIGPDLPQADVQTLAALVFGSARPRLDEPGNKAMARFPG
jgi:nucleoside-diphosphate-sugar epimerase